MFKSFLTYLLYPFFLLRFKTEPGESFLEGFSGWWSMFVWGPLGFSMGVLFALSVRSLPIVLLLAALFYAVGLGFLLLLPISSGSWTYARLQFGEVRIPTGQVSFAFSMVGVALVFMWLLSLTPLNIQSLWELSTYVFIGEIFLITTWKKGVYWPIPPKLPFNSDMEMWMFFFLATLLRVVIALCIATPILLPLSLLHDR